MKSLEESLARLLLSAVSLTGCVWEHPSPTGEVGEVHQALACSSVSGWTSYQLGSYDISCGPAGPTHQYCCSATEYCYYDWDNGGVPACGELTDIVHSRWGACDGKGAAMKICDANDPQHSAVCCSLTHDCKYDPNIGTFICEAKAPVWVPACPPGQTCGYTGDGGGLPDGGDCNGGDCPDGMVHFPDMYLIPDLTVVADMAGVPHGQACAPEDTCENGFLCSKRFNVCCDHDCVCGANCTNGQCSGPPVAKSLCNGKHVCDGVSLDCLPCSDNHSCPATYGCDANGNCQSCAAVSANRTLDMLPWGSVKGSNVLMARPMAIQYADHLAGTLFGAFVVGEKGGPHIDTMIADTTGVYEKSSLQIAPINVAGWTTFALTTGHYDADQL